MIKKYIEYEDGKRVLLDEDDAPEWTEQDFKTALRGREALEKIFGKKNADDIIHKRVGRPIAEHPKQKVTIRLDDDILQALRASGSGWQTRLNDKIREWVSS